MEAARGAHAGERRASSHGTPRNRWSLPSAGKGRAWPATTPFAPDRTLPPPRPRAQVLTLPGGEGTYRGCPADNATESGSSYPSVSHVVGLCNNDCFDYNPVSNPLASFFRQVRARGGRAHAAAGSALSPRPVGA